MTKPKTKTYQKSDGTTFENGDVDWTEFDKMSDKETHRRALDDPDAQPPTEDELKEFKPAHPKKKGETRD